MRVKLFPDSDKRGFTLQLADSLGSVAVSLSPDGIESHFGTKPDAFQKHVVDLTNAFHTIRLVRPAMSNYAHVYLDNDPVPILVDQKIDAQRIAPPNYAPPRIRFGSFANGPNFNTPEVTPGKTHLLIDYIRWRSGATAPKPTAIEQNTSCTFNDTTVSHGASVTAYQSSSVSAGQQCASETRTCNNGTLSGSYTFASCVSDGGGASCTLGGVTVGHGASRTFYSAAQASAGSSCSALAQSRTCTNGTLTGSASYSHASCQESSTPTLKVTLTCRKNNLNNDATNYQTSTCYNDVAILRWALVQGATSCTAYTNATDSKWSGAKPTSATQTIEQLSSSRIYTLTCYGSGGAWGTDSITVQPASSVSESGTSNIASALSALESALKTLLSLIR